MKASVLFLTLLLGQIYRPAMPQEGFHPVPPDGPAIEASADFPLHVHIIESIWHYDRFGFLNGWGHGDLLGAAPRGFDFTFECVTPFRHNMAQDDFYQARWKKPDQKMEILLQKIGSNHLDKCVVNVTMRKNAYGKYSPAKDSSAPTP
jgi:hypothetical protein